MTVPLIAKKLLSPKRRFAYLLRDILPGGGETKVERVKSWYLSLREDVDLFEEAKKLASLIEGTNELAEGYKFDESYKVYQLGKIALFFLSANQPENALYFTRLAETYVGRPKRDTQIEEKARWPLLHETIRDFAKKMVRGLPLDDIYNMTTSPSVGGELGEINPTDSPEKAWLRLVLNDYMRTRFGKDDKAVGEGAEWDLNYLIERGWGRLPWESKKESGSRKKRSSPSARRSKKS